MFLAALKNKFEALAEFAVGPVQDDGLPDGNDVATCHQMRTEDYMIHAANPDARWYYERKRWAV